MPNRAPRGRPRDELVTRAILDATIAILAGNTGTELSVEAIARQAGVSRPSVYKRWPTLADLLLDATLEARSQAMPPGAEQGFPAPDTGSLAGDLQALVEVGSAVFASLEQGGVIQALLAESIRSEEVARRFEETILAPDEHVLRSIFDRAQERGEWHDTASAEFEADPVLVLRALIAHAIFERYILHRPFEGSLTHRLAELLSRSGLQAG